MYLLCNANPCSVYTNDVYKFSYDAYSVGSLSAVIVKFTFLIQEKIMHNKCLTDGINIEDAPIHGAPCIIF